MTFLASKCP